MTDLGTLLPLIGTALFSLAVLSLVLWPVLVALLEISKAIRSAVPANKGPTPFVLTNTGETIWFAASRNAVSKSPSIGEKKASLQRAPCLRNGSCVHCVPNGFLVSARGSTGRWDGDGGSGLRLHADLFAVHAACLRSGAKLAVARAGRFPRGPRCVRLFRFVA